MSTRTVLAAIVILCTGGCGKGGGSDPATPTETVDVRVEIGDCAGPEVAWVSGPRPMPLEPDRGEPAGDGFAEMMGVGGPASGLGEEGYDRLGSEIGEQGGSGAGLSGTAGGGAGPFIGPTGSIGRRGRHGSGNGSDRVASPSVTPGEAKANGSLDKDIIRRHIRRNLSKVRYCYEKELLSRPTLTGTVSAEFTIDPSGVVVKSTAAGVDPAVAGCISRMIQGIRFPKPRGGGFVVVRYPFTLRPAEGTSSEPVFEQNDAPPSGEERPGGQDRAHGDGDASARAEAIDRARKAGILGKPDGARSGALPYRPGAESPLRGHEAGLGACFREQARPYGVSVIELGFDAAGTVISSSVHGVEDAAFRACVGKLTRTFIRTAAAPSVKRCSVAFGVMPAAEARGLDITADALRLDGQKIADPRTIVADGSDALKIDAVYGPVRVSVERAAGSIGPAVRIDGPMVVRPIEATPMKVVTRSLATLTMAGEDPVLAAPRGAAWRLLRDVTLPAVPVPRGTRGSWNTPDGAARGGPFGFSAPATLSVLVTRQAIWVGQTHATISDTLPAGGDQLARLAQVIGAHKRSEAFAERTYAEIAADDDVTYGQVVEVIDALASAGFTGWTIVAPTGLSALPPDGAAPR